MGLAERLVLRRVGVDELGDLGRQRLPVVDQLGFADLLAHTVADHVDADHRTVLDLDELDLARGVQDLALAVAREVVLQSDDLVRAVDLLGLGLGDADGGDLRVAVRHPRDTVVVDRNGLQTGQTLRHQDALGEADVRELERRNQVADGGDGRDVGAHVLVDEDVAAVHGDALLLVAETGGDRAAADGDEQDLGLELLAVGEGDLDTVRGVLGLREEGAQVELDAALAERALKKLGGVRPRPGRGA